MRSQPVSGNGRWWPSQTACARDLGVGKPAVTGWLDRGTIDINISRRERKMIKMSQEAVLAKLRRDETITPEDTCSTIASGEELEAYRDGLKARSALTGEALGAIEQRRSVLVKRGRA